MTAGRFDQPGARTPRCRGPRGSVSRRTIDFATPCLSKVGPEQFEAQSGSNRRPLTCHASALPAELRAQWEPGKCSYEFVVSCPVDLALLIVPRRADTKAHRGPTDRHLEGEEVTRVELLAVRGDRIDLAAVYPRWMNPSGPRRHRLHRTVTTSPSRTAHLHWMRINLGRRSKTRSYGASCVGRETTTPDTTAALVIAASAIAPFWFVVSSSNTTHPSERLGQAVS